VHKVRHKYVHVSPRSLESEQMAVFVGHAEVFSYDCQLPEGLRKTYRCDALGLTRSLLIPRPGAGWLVVPPPHSVWNLDNETTTYRSLNEVADAILLARYKAEQRRQAAVLSDSRHQAAVLMDLRCGQTWPAASTQ